MASGIFALLDDISMLMDDIVAMSKVATKKTAGILGDDLAVTAEQASGFLSSRELPVIWAIARGSFVNKLIILPLAFLLSAFVPWVIPLVLMLGGVYLAYEGTEKIYEYLFHKTAQQREAVYHPDLGAAEAVTMERQKIRSAIRTDFILSIEIVIIALSTVSGKPVLVQIGAVSIVSVIATIGVYGLVAMLVRMDDVGYRLVALGKGGGRFLKAIGRLLVRALPKVIKALAVIGTIAMLLVAGGIFVHNVEILYEMLHGLPSFLGELIVGAAVGSMALAPVEVFRKIRK
ncbi:MAG TPA: DUF808 domain-containing protein [Thermodesulfobacteriaceae bacterium]|nr:DUF808 domain-containing protein [Thermodesulfobacteriaceae bacterium]